MEQAAPAVQLPPVAADAPPPPAANPSPFAFAPPSSHPSYAEMITAAIVWDSTQGKIGGSSKRAIAKYIDRVYTNLPPSHPALLTHHLKRLRNSGHLVMIKNSYQLASVAPAPPAPAYTGSAPVDTGFVPQQPPPANPTPKRGPGRPIKRKMIESIGPALVQVQTNGPQPAKKRGRPPKQQIQQHQIVMEPAEVPFVQPVTQAQPVPANGQPVQKRRPGRPPKQAQPPVVPFAQPAFEAEAHQAMPLNAAAPAGVGVVAKRRRGRPPKYNVGGPGVPVTGSVGRPGGRPKKSTLGPVSRPAGKRPRGRPPKLGGAGAAVGMVSGKRRGRPPRGSGPPKLRKLSGKPLGRPRKNAAVWNKHTSEQGVTNEELTRKLELIQSKVRDAVGIIRPLVANESAAFMVLQQLEELMTPNVTAPSAAPPIAPPPMMATSMTLIAPSGAPPAAVSYSSATNLTPPPPGVVTAAPTGTVTAPILNAPAPFSVSLPPMSVAAPFQAPSGMDSQQAMSWMPPSEAES